MKTKLLFALFFISYVASAQVSTVYTGLNTPVGLEAHGNDLYIAELQSNRVVKLDISTNNPPLQVVTNLSGAEGLALQGNNLRITNLTGSIRTVNVLASTPTSAGLYYGTPHGVGARAITYDSSQGMYIGTAYQGNKTRIYRVNNSSSGTLITTITGAAGTDVRDLVVIGNYLYAAHRHQGIIYRIDLTQANPTPVAYITGVALVNGLAAVGNRLYFTLEGGRLYRIDDIDNPSLTLLISGGQGNFGGIEIIGNDVFISGWSNGGRILKYNDATLSTDTFSFENFTIYPNPTKDNLHINSSESIEKLEIYNYLGQKVLKSTNSNVNVSSLTKGVYLLKVFTNTDKIGIKRFVKE